MKVRIIRAFNNYRVGDVISPPAILRNDLIRRRFVEPVKEPIETAEAPVMETTDRTHRRRAIK